LEPERQSSQFLTSWFDQDYRYRIEEGDLRWAPSKIEAVRCDGEDFDNLYLQNLLGRLKATVFPPSLFKVYFETDEFRRFVRIYIDTAHNSFSKRKKDEPSWSVIPKNEIQFRISSAR
jgi:hypothetical protein